MDVSSIPTQLANSLITWETLQRQWDFSGHRLMSAWSFLIAAALLGVVITSLWAWRTYRAGPIKSTPMIVFLQLARGLGVSATDQWLLIRVSLHEALPTPLTLMLSPDTFEYHTRAYLKTLPEKRRARVADQLTRLGRFLFNKPVVRLPMIKPTTTPS